MLPTVDLSDIADTLTHAGEDMVRACEESRVLIEPAPQTLIQGFLALIDTLRASDAELPHQRGEDLRRVTGAEPDALLAHGLELLGMLVLSAQRLGLTEPARSLEFLSIPFSCWLLRRGAELADPSMVVSALVTLADHVQAPEDLAELIMLMTEIAAGMSNDHTQDLDPTNPTEPWAMLLLHRGIVATRAHQPDLMRDAFAAIESDIPEQAPAFFREAMGEMEARPYPPKVSALVQEYYERWCHNQRLH